MAKQTAKRRPYLVTTEFRGVFFGYTDDPDAEIVVLTDARLCVSWSADMHGFTGLAATGPGEACRIGPTAPEVRLRGVTSVSAVAEEAEARWLAATW